uniref:Annexin n=1 Tax=Parascaris univalens TaxID=6257 RepID=A0A915C3R9_PARUN
QGFFGTIRPQTNFDASETAENLKKAMKGFGCDKKKVVHELTRINNAQRQIVAAEYAAKYGTSLMHDLKSELHGDLEEVILALMLSPAVYDSRHLQKAICGLGTDEQTLIDVICTRSNQQLNAIKVAYEGEFHRSLESAVKWDTSGDFERLLVALLQARRDESNVTNPQKAREQAEKLYAAGEKRWGTDEAVFTSILVTENFNQLRLVFNEYSTLCGHEIEKAIESEFSGDAKKGFLTLIECIRNPPKYFASRLYDTMKGLGTRDSELIRLIVSRSECDLALIRDEYPKQYGRTLVEDIRSDCSGAYRDCLIAIVQGN